MESDRRYYSRRAAQEKMAAARAMTETARVWHSQLADDYMRKAQQVGQMSAAE